MHFGKRFFVGVGGYLTDHIEGENEIERFGPVRNVAHRSLRDSGKTASAYALHGFRSDVEARNRRRGAQFGKPVAGAAGGIEHRFAVCEAGGKAVAGDMLVQQVVVHQPRDDAEHAADTHRERIKQGRNQQIRKNVGDAEDISDGDRFTVWTPTQGIFATRQLTADVLGVSPSDVRVVPMPVGGAFGAKVCLLEPIACLLSRAVGRPVWLTLTRREVFLLGRAGPAAAS